MIFERKTHNIKFLFLVAKKQFFFACNLTASFIELASELTRRTCTREAPTGKFDLWLLDYVSLAFNANAVPLYD
jgi:hypothetical protein